MLVVPLVNIESLSIECKEDLDKASKKSKL
uniref:Uncharacterized protein n=1 Tax=Rhizophora mucronata TaxID=61149 RepID=A0A2P2MZ93_RHIMU